MRWLLLGWVTLWFVVIAPAHNRGSVPTPDAEISSSQARQPVLYAPRCAACLFKTPDFSKTSDGQENEDDAPAPSGHCAICYLNAVLSTPPPPLLPPAVTATTQVINHARPATPALRMVRLPLLERGPPTTGA